MKRRRDRSTPNSDDDIGMVIERARRAKAEEDQRHRQERDEKKLREAPLIHLIDAWRYRAPTGRSTDPQNWVGILHRLLKAAAPLVEGDILAHVPPRGHARRVLLHVCDLIRSASIDQAVRMLANAFDSALESELWEDLSQYFPEDVSRLLPEELQENFKGIRHGKSRETAAFAAEMPGAGPVTSPNEAGTPPPLELTLGGFRLHGVSMSLPGKPLGVLRSLMNARDRCQSFAELREAVWGRDSLATEQNVKDAVKVLRAALRKGREKAKGALPESDPLPHIGKGADLAWELKLDLLR